MSDFHHPACLQVDELIRQCEIKRTRSGGPGGQHRNKVETAVVVTHRPTGIVGQAGERRSQQANRDMALQRLRVNLAIQIRNDKTNTQPSELWRSRCIGGKIKVSPQHFDFACLLAEALDHIEACELQVAAAAKVLGCSTTQLINLLKLEDSAFALVNRRRRKAGLGPLR